MFVRTECEESADAGADFMDEGINVHNLINLFSKSFCRVLRVSVVPHGERFQTGVRWSADARQEKRGTFKSMNYCKLQGEPLQLVRPVPPPQPSVSYQKPNKKEQMCFFPRYRLCFLDVLAAAAVVQTDRQVVQTDRQTGGPQLKETLFSLSA